MSQWFSGVGPHAPRSPAQAATLLLDGVVKEHEANHPPKLGETNPAESNAIINYTSTHPLVRKTSTETQCHLCFFPFGVSRRIFKCYRLHRYEFLPHKGLIAFVSSSWSDQLGQTRIHIYENGSFLAETNLGEKLNCIGLESRDRLAVAHDGHIDIYDRQNKRYAKTEQVAMRGHLPSVTKFAGEILLIGTKTGGVFGYNVRKGQFAWVFQAEGKGSVYDLQMRKEIVYVSSAGGLWMWDMTTNAKTRRQFLGHRNRGKKMTFDIDTELGLLAAGGDDGVVRIWNCRSGEDPVGDLKLPGEIPTAVRFVRDARNEEEVHGLWIATKRKLYTCLVRSGSLF